MTSYSYDRAGNVLTTTDANGATATRTYDALNRVASSTAVRAGTTEAVSWAYDDATQGGYGIGRLATLTDPTGATSYQYEHRGMLRAETKTINATPYTTSYTYDNNGNRNTITYPSGLNTQYTFDFANRPFSLTAGTTTVVSAASYLPFGPLTSLAFGNGTTRAMQFDNRYRPLENKLTGPSGTIADYTYTEDNVGNITQLHDAIDPSYNRTFTYDDLSRLTSANTGASLWGTGSYTYDAMGNMLSSSLGTWKSTVSALAGTTPQLSTITENGAPRTVTYDSAGNEVGVGAATYVYSPRNALVAADGNSYVYDGRGVLTAATFQTFTLSISAPSVTAGGTATGTVTLPTPTSADLTATLSSDNTAAGVPATLTIPAGSASATFPISTSTAGSSAPLKQQHSFSPTTISPPSR